MATSNLLQQLGVAADGFGASTSNRRQVETFIAGGTITVGDWVAFDTTRTGADKLLTVIEAGASANGTATVVGVALAAATVGQNVEVIVSGYAAAANTNGAPGAGAPLVVQTAAGAADAAGAGITAPPCGVALAASVANKAEVWVYKRF